MTEKSLEEVKVSCSNAITEIVLKELSLGKAREIGGVEYFKINLKLHLALKAYAKNYQLRKFNTRLNKDRFSENFVDFSDLGITMEKSEEGQIRLKDESAGNTLWHACSKPKSSYPSLNDVADNLILSVANAIYMKSIDDYLEGIKPHKDFKEIKNFLKLRAKFENTKIDYTFTEKKPDFVPGLSLLSKFSPRVERLCILKLFWSSGFYSKEVFKLCQKVNGLNVSLADYNGAAYLLQYAKRTLEESNLGILVLRQPKFWQLSLSDSAKASNTFIIQGGSNALKDAKEFYRLHGLSNQGWKWLGTQTHHTILWLTTTKEGLVIANTFAALGVGKLPKLPTTLQSLLRSAICLKPLSGKDIFFNIKNSAAKQLAVLLGAKNRKSSLTLLTRDLELIFDFVYAMHVTYERETEGLEKYNVKENTTFKNMLKAAERYHRDLITDKSNIDESAKWPSITGNINVAIENSEIVFEELTTGIQLRDEGVKMLHCVGGFHHYCKTGQRIIYSVKKNGVHVSTLSMSRDNRKGNLVSLDQHYGLKNSIVPKILKKSADIAIKRANSLLSKKKKAANLTA